jgi:hypothetical protein
MMKVLSTGWTTFHETGKYTCATAEYAGLFSYSIVKRSGSLVTSEVLRVTRPVARAVTWPFGFVWEKTTGVLTSRKQKARIRGLEEKMVELEQRLGHIEKHGVFPAGEASRPKKGKDLDDDKRIVLAQILEDTKTIREAE